MHSKILKYLYILAPLEIDSKEIILSIHRKIFIEALFIIKIQKQTPKCPEMKGRSIQ